MTVVLPGAVIAWPATSIGTPDGVDVTDTVFVFGWSWTLVVVFEPAESVAVSRISSFDGYSWSGAENEPLVPVACSTKCSWQSAGQWRRTRSHDSREPPSVPSSWSVAWPEYEMESPTAQVRELAGLSMTGTGGAFVASMRTVVVSDRPFELVTCSPTAYTPGVATDQS